ncbi:uncharacterized protein [Prorops nasuta]|uniref:uncharacterized protein isoform X1 n=1 Tax=Prorops nasuta TaxID=863751 RepID=UPI0034CE7EF9
MELEEEEPQICRLCGQCESIYIDVFGEEGTKRFLGLKIHSKINILVKENDELSKLVCVTCLATLEFLCDFHDRCELTQKVLLQTLNKKKKVKALLNDINKEFDKENHVPSEIKRKSKPSPTEAQKMSKHCLAINTVANKKFDIEPNIIIEKEENIKSNDEGIRSFSAVQTGIVATKPIPLNPNKENQQNTNLLDVKGKIQLKESPKSQVRKIYENSDPKINEKIFQSKNEYDVGDLLNSEEAVKIKSSKNEKQQEKYINNNCSEHTQQLRRSSRKIKTTYSKKDQVLPIRKRNMKKKKLDEALSEMTKDNLKNQCMTLNLTNDASISIKSDEEISSEIILVDNDFLDQVTDKSNERSSVIIKKRKADSPKKVTPKRGYHSWFLQHVISSRGPYWPKTAKKISNTSPPPGDEAEMSHDDIDASSDITEVDGSYNIEYSENEQGEQFRASVIKFPQSGIDSFAIKTSAESISDETEKNSSENESKDCIYDIMTDEEGKKTRKRQTSHDRNFGKLSELLTEEQKQEIEKYYKFDESIIDQKGVHKNVTNLGNKYQCNICQKIYTRHDKCKVHLWGHLNIKPYQCTACDFSTVTISNVRCHIRKSHLKIKPFACHLCNKRYVTSILLEDHLNVHTGAKPYRCKNCKFSSSSRQVLSYHMTTHKLVKDIICSYCGKEFYSKSRMRAHMLIHMKDKVSMCKICSAYLSNEASLKAHHEKVHSRDYICSICNKVFKSSKGLHNHQNVHSAAKYKCPICPNVYKSKHILKEHLLKHEGIRKYKCSDCDKTFAQQSHLAAHMAVHSSVRFCCPGCKRPFNRHDNMKIHTKRCLAFLANPELKNLIVRRERKKSDNQNSTDFNNANESVLSTSIQIKTDDIIENNKVMQKEIEQILNVCDIDKTANVEENYINYGFDESKRIVVENQLRTDQF